MVDGDGKHQNTLGDGPDEGTPLDVLVGGSSRKIDLPDGQLRHDVVGSGLRVNPNEVIEVVGSPNSYLAVAGSERHPSGGGPPGDYETEKSGVVWTGTFGSPYVDGPTEG